MTNKLLCAAAFIVAMIFVGLQASPAQAPKGVLVALNKGDSTLAIIDPVQMKVIAKVATGDSPHEVVLSADAKTAFVANYGDGPKPGNSISMIDVAAAKEIRRVNVSPLQRPHDQVWR